MYFSPLTICILVYIVSCVIGRKVLDTLLSEHSKRTLPPAMYLKYYNMRHQLLILYHIPVLNTLYVLVWVFQFLFLRRLKIYRDLKKQMQEEDRTDQ